MPKMIEIKTCMDCPHNDHKGAFGKIAYIPVCKKTGKSQDYTVSGSGKQIAVQSTEIPKWCPLDESIKKSDFYDVRRALINEHRMYQGKMSQGIGCTVCDLIAKFEV